MTRRRIEFWGRLSSAVLAVFTAATISIAQAQQAGGAPDVRRALIIANQNYSDEVGPLLNPLNDAALVATALGRHGFEIETVTDASRGQILAAVRRHARALGAAGARGVGMIYYAGHGAAPLDSARNYIIPVTVADASSEALWDDSVALDRIREILSDRAPSAAHIVVFDACRNELKLPTRSIGDGSGRGFKLVGQDWGEMLLAFSTAPGSVAWDGDAASGASPYAQALADELGRAAEAPRATAAAELFANVGRTVRARRPQQAPWVSIGAGRPVFFGDAADPEPQPAPQSAPRAAGTEVSTALYLEAVALRSPELMRSFIEQYPASPLRPAAEERLARWAARAANPPEPSEPPAPIEAPKVETPPLVSAPEPPPVDTPRESQIELARLGYYLGPIDGDWGPQSMAALQAFERDNALEPTGLAAPNLLALLRAAAPPPPPDVSPGARFRDCPFCPEMAALEGGAALLGAAPGEQGAGPEERPRREVRVGPFAIGVAEVTRAEYAKFAEATGRRGARCFTWAGGAARFRGGASWADPGFEQGPEEPAVCLSYRDAQAYVAWLNETLGPAKLGGARYRLPTEAEWVYAARAGTRTPWLWGGAPNGGCGVANGNDLSTAAVHGFKWPNSTCDDGFAKTAPARALRPNAFGLHHISGNAWEWVEGCWSGRLQAIPSDGGPVRSGDCGRAALRGGSWDDQPLYLRVAKRIPYKHGVRSHVVGLRVARDLPGD